MRRDRAGFGKGRGGEGWEKGIDYTVWRLLGLSAHQRLAFCWKLDIGTAEERPAVGSCDEGCTVCRGMLHMHHAGAMIGTLILRCTWMELSVRSLVLCMNNAGAIFGCGLQLG